MITRPNAEAPGPFGHTLGEPLPDDAEPLGGLYVSRFTAGIWIVELIGVPELGVCNIRASRRVETNEFGHQAVTTADEVVHRITEKYGEPDVTHDYLLDGSLWTEPRDWMTALQYQGPQERDLSADTDSPSLPGYNPNRPRLKFRTVET